ncbi:hypothetical protein AVEN_88407-1 [Araneus ventricosus]|uniref:Uncharacterized protein n=1 Tax=Araneus ventricosus TaxID=182803 RepID=A0A4Y2PLP4_ARAVE|nr:hypothetical protein AVEN_88407-1 [Araneus ventricosus]
MTCVDGRTDHFYRPSTNRVENFQRKMHQPVNHGSRVHRLTEAAKEMTWFDRILANAVTEKSSKLLKENQHSMLIILPHIDFVKSPVENHRSGTSTSNYFFIRDLVQRTF